LSPEPGRAGQRARAADRLGVAVTIRRLVGPDAHPAGLLAEADLVISTLPAGAGDPLAEAGWRPEQAVLDVVYHPWPTALAGAAATAGARVISGASMLLFQAARQVELMTGSAAPVAAMRAALLAAAPGCGG
ncbi:MAG: shikimate dehydrogenase, partial [Jatrophihabitans sp.]